MTRAPSTLGRMLLELRKERGFASAESLADAAGLTRETVARLECGEKQSAHAKTVAKLAAALGVSTDELQGIEYPEISAAVAEYLRVYEVIDRPTDTEKRWLRYGTSPSFWRGMRPPVPDLMHDLLMMHRRNSQ